MKTVHGIELDAFTLAYITCALWSTNDESNEQGGEPLDQNFGPEDITPEALRQMHADCERFRAEFGSLLDAAAGRYHLEDEQAGHDLWLTRNHHGAGFWDRGLGDIGDQLTAAAHTFGERSLYIGDDGRIYSE